MNTISGISTWLVLGPIYNQDHQTIDHHRDDGHPIATEIIQDIDDNALKPEEHTRSLAEAPQAGDTAVYGNGKFFPKETHTWRILSFSNVDWENVHDIEDNIHKALGNTTVPADPRNPQSFAGKHHALAFFLVYIYSPDARKTRLCVMSDDALRVWLNGTELPEPLRCIDDRDINGQSPLSCGGISLQQGYNILMAAVSETHVEWGFFAGIENDQGLTMTAKKPIREVLEESEPNKTSPAFLGNRLYHLLPAIHRIRDQERGGALQALLEVMAEQAQTLEADIDRLYDNWFIETCDDWVVPYIGDLIGVKGLEARSGGVLYTPRAQVANTLRYRRRKGTAAMLEQLAHDATGWYARAVEFFERLGTTQHLDHLRPGRGGTVDVRLLVNDAELLGTPFDTIPRTAEVRRISGLSGRYNIPNIGLFLWRLNNHPVSRSTARSLDGGCYSFSPLGNDIPLFNCPQPEPDISHLAEEYNLPGLLRRRPLLMDLQTWREGMNRKTREELKKNSLYFGASPVFQVFLNGNDESVHPEQILIADLSGWDAKAGSADFSPAIAVDPVNGRLLLPGGDNANTQVEVSYAYGFSGDVGGGPYSRQDTVARQRLKQAGWKATVSQSGQAPGDVNGFTTLHDALEAWHKQPAGAFGIIAIADSQSYQEPDLSIVIPAGSELWIIAAAWQNAKALSATGLRPHLRLGGSEGKISVNSSPPAQIENAGYGKLSLNGLLIEGWLEIAHALGILQLHHCTLVPGRSLGPAALPLSPGESSLYVHPACVDLQVDISRGIVGPLHLPTDMRGLTISDSIVDAPTMEKIQVLVSDKLTTLKLISRSPRLEVQIGDEAPVTVPLPKSSVWMPTLAQQKKGASVLNAAAAMLQTAIRAKATGPAYAKASVASLAGRLVIIPGLPAATRVRGVGKDASAETLGLTNSIEVWAYLTQPLSGSLEFDPSPREIVLRLGNRWLILPDFTAPDFNNGGLAAPSPPWPAIAADATGKTPGPPTVIERSTVFGSVHVKELVRASETIFTRSVWADRQQAGCVRFCYVPDPELSTPKRYRCQPDSALEAVSGDAQKRIRDGLAPNFTSMHYGKPGYAQLSAGCPAAILTGGEDDAEMGVFNFLQQPRRQAVLRASLDEYLRAGREAGLFFVT